MLVVVATSVLAEVEDRQICDAAQHPVFAAGGTAAGGLAAGGDAVGLGHRVRFDVVLGASFSESL